MFERYRLVHPPTKKCYHFFFQPFPLRLPSWSINHTTAHLPSEQELVEWNISLLKVLRLHHNDFASAVRVGGC